MFVSLFVCVFVCMYVCVCVCVRVCVCVCVYVDMGYWTKEGGQMMLNMLYKWFADCIVASMPSSNFSKVSCCLYCLRNMTVETSFREISPPFHILFCSASELMIFELAVQVVCCLYSHFTNQTVAAQHAVLCVCVCVCVCVRACVSVCVCVFRGGGAK